MIAWLIAQGLTPRLAKVVRITVMLVALVSVLGGTYMLIRTKGEKAGFEKAAAEQAQAHKKTVAEARSDERKAQATTESIAATVTRADAATDEFVRTTIEDLRDELAAARAAPNSPAPAAAPVASMSASVNDVIARANRAASDADAAP